MIEFFKKMTLRKAVSVYFKVSLLFGAFVGGWVFHMNMGSSFDHCVSTLLEEQPTFPKALQRLMDNFIILTNTDAGSCSYNYPYLYVMLCVYILFASLVLWLFAFVVFGVIKIVKRFEGATRMRWLKLYLKASALVSFIIGESILYIDAMNNKDNLYCLAKGEEPPSFAVSHFLWGLANRYFSINHIDHSPCVIDHWHVILMLFLYSSMYIVLFWGPVLAIWGVLKGIRCVRDRGEG